MYSSAKPIPLFRKYTIELLISSRDHITRKKKDKQASIYEFNIILTRMTTQIILKNQPQLFNKLQTKKDKNKLIFTLLSERIVFDTSATRKQEKNW